MTKKSFDFYSNALIGLTDYLKWTSSFGEGQLQQMETPVSGIRLSASVSSLFGLAQDKAGVMLVMHEQEAAWLEKFPVEVALIGFDDGIQVVSEGFEFMDSQVPQTAFSIFIPSVAMRFQLMRQHSLMGFGLITEEDGKLQVRRVNRIVPLVNPKSYQALRLQKNREESSSVFSAC